MTKAEYELLKQQAFDEYQRLLGAIELVYQKASELSTAAGHDEAPVGHDWLRAAVRQTITNLPPNETFTVRSVFMALRAKNWPGREIVIRSVSSVIAYLAKVNEIEVVSVGHARLPNVYRRAVKGLPTCDHEQRS